MKKDCIITVALSLTWLTLATGIGAALYNHYNHRYFYPFVTTPSGLSYKAMRKGNGRKAQEGEWVQLSVVMKAVSKPQKEEGGKASPKEKILASSLDEPQPFILPFSSDLSNKRIAEMMGMVEEKQRMIFKFSPEYYLQSATAEELEQDLKLCGLKADDELIVDIQIDKIMNQEERIAMMQAKRAEQTAADKKKIEDYLEKNNIQALSTASGLFYSIDQASQEIPVVKHKTVKVHYTGRLLDDKLFDTSIVEVAKANNAYDPQRDYQPIEFQVGAGNVIPGWDEGLLLLKKSEKARFFIPSILAYGTNGIGDVIPSNAILVFEVEVVDVR
ncbi:FKBP-type peptidyl-prolyl cis-trans isomerase [Cardinium endosymbiont of Tipula unca]|uniref:FKBP-type peptidyl-prolyl cis-trans isomerase n=1 Tax=Cardinium endosymbiont of Tipula unca TaxID=3066216 RepID=UPI0030CEFCBD